MPTTYELEGWAARLAMLLDEVPPEQWDAVLGEAVDVYQAEVVDKVDALVAVRAAFVTHAQVCAEDMRAAAVRRGRWEAKAEQIKELLTGLLLANEATTGSASVATSRGTAYLHTSTRVEGPEDPQAWPAEVRQKVETWKVDKRAAAAMLKGGTHLPGVHVVTVRGAAWRG